MEEVEMEEVEMEKVKVGGALPKAFRLLAGLCTPPSARWAPPR